MQTIVIFGLRIAYEHYVNAVGKPEIAKYADIAWSMIEPAYRKIGGCGARGPEDLIKEADILKLCRKNGQFIAVVVYKFHKSGLKNFCAASDGSQEGKDALFQMFKQDFKLTNVTKRNMYMKNRKCFVEVSEAPEHILINKIGCEPIKNKYVAAILDKQILDYNKDGYHYTRMIAGEPREKIMVGFPQFDE